VSIKFVSFCFLSCFVGLVVKDISFLWTLPPYSMARASQLLSVWAAIALLAPVLGTPVSLPVKRSASPGVLAMPISRKSRSISKRDGFQVALSNEEYYYSMSVGIGSPPQSISLELDTGSSDTWAFSPSACSSVTCVGGPCKCTTSLIIHLAHSLRRLCPNVLFSPCEMSGQSTKSS
jgi:hypothetical protein